MTLELRNVTYTYGAATSALRDVTLTIPPGQLIALAGMNGAGKSTLLKIAARVVTPTTGEVSFDQRALRDWPAKDYARRVAYLPQEPESIFPMRAIDVVVSGRAPFLSRFAWEGTADYAVAHRVLAMCDAAHLTDRFLDEMSGGERKRVFLARVLAREPRLVLLDEPLAALDIAHVQQFAKLLRSLVTETGSTIVFAAHELNWVAAYSDRVIVLRDGALGADVPPTELMNADRIRDLFGFEAQTVSAGGRNWIVPR